MIIKADVLRVFEVDAFTLRFNSNTGLIPENCKCNDSTLMCICSNLTTEENNGTYAFYVSFIIPVGNNITSNPEWCSNNVTVIVQGET